MIMKGKSKSFGPNSNLNCNFPNTLLENYRFERNSVPHPKLYQISKDHYFNSKREQQICMEYQT